MKIIIKDYDPMWPEMFQMEACRIKSIYKDNIIKIYHIGSTSVPYLKAKPIIDIMPAVKDIDLIDPYNDKMIKIGYEPLGEYGIPGRRFFRKGKNKRTHHVHIFQSESHDIIRHIAFRDYLRNSSETADEYIKLKENLARLYPHDSQAYCDGKSAFIKDIEKKALLNR